MWKGKPTSSKSHLCSYIELSAFVVKEFFYNKNKSIFTIIFWADNHAFRTAAMFDNISSSQNQNKNSFPLGFHKSHKPIHLHMWRHELWRWCGRDYHMTFQSFTNNFCWNLWRSECAKMVINFFWRSLSFSKFALLQRVRVVNGIQPENCKFFSVKMG